MAGGGGWWVVVVLVLVLVGDGHDFHPNVPTKNMFKVAIGNFL